MFRAQIWLFTTMFAVGVIGAMGYMLTKSGVPPNIVDRSPELKIEEVAGGQFDLDSILTAAEEEDAKFVEDLIRQGDRSLSIGNFHAAMMRYKKANKVSPMTSTPLTIRLAICAENTGNLLLAERLYDQVVLSTRSTIHRQVGILGQIRVWQQLQKPVDSLRAASELFLRSEDHGSLPIMLRAQLLYELTNLVQVNALQDYHFDPSRFDGVLFHAETRDVMSEIDLVSDVEKSLEIANDESLSVIEEGIQLIQRPSHSPNVVILSAKKSPTPLKQLLLELGAVGQLEIQASSHAQSKMSARSKSLHFKNLSLSLVLDSLLTQLDLIWIQDEESHSLKIVGLDEIENPEERKRLEIEVADRMLRHFAVTFPSDYRFGSVMLARGNVQLISGDIDAAGNSYEMVAQSNPVNELRAKLSYNQGKLSMMLGRDTMAIDQLYLAVDQTFDPLIKSSGYWWIAKLFLERNDLTNSLYASGRALAVARRNQEKQLAALTLARTYLFRNDPASANQVLFTHHREFEESPLRASVTVLSNYAQFIGVEDENSRSVAEERLILALSVNAGEPSNSFLDCYIAGRAYQELGFPELAIEKLTQAASLTDAIVWRHQILFALALEKIKTGQEKDAGRIFEFLVEEDADVWGRLARMELGALYLRNEMSEKCVLVCEKLLALELNQAEKAKVLTMMGFAYRNLNRHHTSALCFAGMVEVEQNEQR